MLLRITLNPLRYHYQTKYSYEDNQLYGCLSNSHLAENWFSIETISDIEQYAKRKLHHVAYDISICFEENDRLGRKKIIGCVIFYNNSAIFEKVSYNRAYKLDDNLIYEMFKNELRKKKLERLTNENKHIII